MCAARQVVCGARQVVCGARQVVCGLREPVVPNRGSPHGLGGVMSSSVCHATFLPLLGRLSQTQ